MTVPTPPQPDGQAPQMPENSQPQQPDANQSAQWQAAAPAGVPDSASAPAAGEQPQSQFAPYGTSQPAQSGYEQSAYQQPPAYGQQQGNPTYAQPGYQPYQPGYQQAPTQTPMSIVAIVSLVLGIIALLMSWIPLVNWLGGLLALVGLGLGIAGVVQARKRVKRGMALAVAGIVTAVLALIVTVVMQFVFFNAVSSIERSTPNDAQMGLKLSDVEDREDAESDASDFTVSDVKVYTGVQDYEGKPAMIVSYTFTNNSQENVSAFVKAKVTAFQNKLELEPALITDETEGYDSGTPYVEVQPGGSLTVTQAYVLGDETSPVTVSVEPMFSFDKTKILEQEFQL